MKRNYLIIIILFILCHACGDDMVNGPKGSTETPLKVTLREVNDISGASVIYYDRPDDKNLLYVRAVWTTDDDIEYVRAVSFYTDSILVDGFGKEGTYVVKLYSVSAGEACSEPVEVEVNPGRPPYLVAYDSLQILPTFMGVRVVTENETAAKLAFRTFKKDTVGNEWIEMGTDYSLNPNIEYFNRGHAPDTAQYFRVQVRDRWGHWSPPKDTVCIPWFEKELPKNLFREIALCNIGGDGSSVPDQTGQVLPSNFWGHKMHSWSGSNVQFERLYDNKWGNSQECYHTKPLAPLPQHFTLDLGGEYNLSRFILWPRKDNSNLFRGGHPQIVRLYGATYSGPDPGQLVDDIYDASAWIDLGLLSISRADGSFDPYPGTGDRSAEDDALIEKGHELTLNAINKGIRYVRVQTIKCFTTAAASAVMIDEISFFGSDSDQ
ncbi:MAG: DUF4959 domain-containing protein [Proteiniphilum sp.]|jgi:hypothetical protein|nr:DUF4959 domain-containing protein [Proteiniphilum sp.]